MRKFKSHGSGKFKLSDFYKIGKGTILEAGVLVFHPENIQIGNNVYIGHRTILKGYYQNKMLIGNHVWIGQDCFLHSGGGILIQDAVGIGPHVKLLTIVHSGTPLKKPIIDTLQKTAPIIIETGCDIGIGTIILPGIKIGSNSQIGAGSVVSRDIPAFSVAAGVPARIIRKRK